MLKYGKSKGVLIMNNFIIRFRNILSENSHSGMEMVQVALLIGIAIAIGLIFKEKIGSFINGVFGQLNADTFTTLK